MLLNVKGAFLVAASVTRRKSNVLPAVSSLPQCTGGTTTQKALLYIQGPINIFGAAAYARFCKRRHGGKTCCRLAQLPICNKTGLAHAMLDITHAQTAETDSVQWVPRVRILTTQSYAPAFTFTLDGHCKACREWAPAATARARSGH